MNDFDVSIGDLTRLMQDFLEKRIGADEYRLRFFRLTTKRVEPHSEAAEIVIQKAYGDADDFDSNVRLPYTIEEPELRTRVVRSMAELVRLGHAPAPMRENS